MPKFDALIPKLLRASAAVVASVPPSAMESAVPSASSPLIVSFLFAKPSVAVPKNAKQLPLLATSNAGTDFEIYVESVYVLDTPSVPLTTTVTLTV